MLFTGGNPLACECASFRRPEVCPLFLLLLHEFFNLGKLLATVQCQVYLIE